METLEIIGQLKTDLNAAKELKTQLQKFIWSVAKVLEASQGAFYLVKEFEGKTVARFEAGYAYFVPESQVVQFEMGEGLVGQVAQTGELININDVPEGYIQVISGLGKATPSSLIVFPVLKNTQVVAVFELASFKIFSEEQIKLITEATKVLTDTVL